MRNINLWIGRMLVVAVAFVFCGGPEFAQAQTGAAQTQPSQAQSGGSDATQGPQSTLPPEPVPDANNPNAPAPDANTSVTTTGSGQQAAPAPSVNQPSQGPTTPGSIIDPSKGPLQPIPSGLPDAPSANQQQQTAPATNPTPTPAQAAPQQRPAEHQPLGAATAEGARTVGGGASKPAGAAIAPAKQRQVRSLLIKLGAIAGAGIAIGTVYALSRGTPSVPPGASNGTAANPR